MAPSIHGPAIAERLRLGTPGLPVLYITGHPDSTELQGEAILKKPFSRGELTRAIAAALGDDLGL